MVSCDANPRNIGGVRGKTAKRARIVKDRPALMANLAGNLTGVPKKLGRESHPIAGLANKRRGRLVASTREIRGPILATCHLHTPLHQVATGPSDIQLAAKRTSTRLARPDIRFRCHVTCTSAGRTTACFPGRASPHTGHSRPSAHYHASNPRRPDPWRAGKPDTEESSRGYRFQAR